MNKPEPKPFDCVHSMRQVRDRVNAEISDMGYDDLVRWLKSYRYKDPVLQRLAQKANQHGAAAEDSAHYS